MTTVASKSRSEPRPVMGVRVVTRDGTVYDFGKQRTGRLLGPVSVWLMNRRIEKYRRARLATITNPRERAEFEAQIAALKGAE